MRILTVNAGSSTVKIRVLDGHGSPWRLVCARDLDADRGRPDPGELRRALSSLGPIDGVGHRVVHGGHRFTGPAAVDRQVRWALGDLSAMAPLHQPPALAAMDATSALLPDTPAVAAFDTAFHARLPAAASTYAVPTSWRTTFGVRRFGFHGLAHEWAAHRTVALVPEASRIVVAHLGSGASLCAVTVDTDGAPHSVDTTMGYTPTAGLVMGTRCGDLDPAVPLYLVERHHLPAATVAAALDRESGLLGLAGTSDMRTVLDREGAGDPNAVLAIEVWLHRLRAGIAAMTAALGGLDALVFSGGVGENQPELRRRTVNGLGYLGLALDATANATSSGSAEADISAHDAPARTLVVHAREDIVMAQQVRDVLGALGPVRARAVRPGHWGPVSPVHYGAGGRRSEV
ncbi:MAG: Acetate kinase [Pseudonocardia sp.]|jgi:acetate kinase|uniref:acetate/propionate family kinase n=1 Tax=Pseudonocardia sp. TaxID=60912 RepID=UPI0026100545|nr:acetate/propionate family kinase [Pseudonocardia sp.]MCU1631203.1 Acetate kinase [Pseudonocardia sp.]